MSLSWCQACSSCSSCVQCDAMQDSKMLHFPNVKLCCVVLRCAKLWDLQLCIIFHAGLQWSYLMFSSLHCKPQHPTPYCTSATVIMHHIIATADALHQSRKGDSMLLLLTGDLWKSSVWSVDGCRTCQRDWWEEPNKPSSNCCLMMPLVFFSIIQ